MAAGERWAYQRSYAWRRVHALGFELNADGRSLATLTVGELEAGTASLETGEHRIVFVTEGMGSRIRIYDADSQRIIASYQQRWSGRSGTIQFTEGGQLEWRRGGRLFPAYVFTDGFGNPLVRVRRDGGVIAYGVGTGLDPLVGSWRDLAVALALGWLLLLGSG
jgi:hypothetical protein